MHKKLSILQADSCKKDQKYPGLLFFRSPESKPIDQGNIRYCPF
jgi:hypothetical protein